MIDYLKMIDERHSVRSYKPMPIEPDKAVLINEEIARLNAESGLNIQLLENRKAVGKGLAALFAGWKNTPPAVITLAGKPDSDTDGGDVDSEEGCMDLEEKCGYYGEKLVLYLQALGLNTCWVGMFNKKHTKPNLAADEKLIVTIAVGYGENQGKEHKSKPIAKVTDVKDMPDWFARGVYAALKAPTAINQQKFFISLEGDEPTVWISGLGPFVKVDLGIVKCHFEIATGRKVL